MLEWHEKSKEELEQEFPVELKLRFRSEEELHYFLGQLSDGWGENYVNLGWPTFESLHQHLDCVVVDPTVDGIYHRRRAVMAKYGIRDE